MVRGPRGLRGPCAGRRVERQQGGVFKLNECHGILGLGLFLRQRPKLVPSGHFLAILRDGESIIFAGTVLCIGEDTAA